MSMREGRNERRSGLARSATARARALRRARSGIRDIEPLEARLHLTVVPSLTGSGTVRFSGDAGDQLYLSIQSGVLAYKTDPSGTYSSDLDPNTPGVQSLGTTGLVTIHVDVGGT